MDERRTTSGELTDPLIVHSIGGHSKESRGEQEDAVAGNSAPRYSLQLIYSCSAREMSHSLEIKWPWEMIWIEYADEIITQIKDALPPDHELQKHDLFPGIKWDGRQIYIEDGTLK